MLFSILGWNCFSNSLARFSSESGETHVMSREWVMPIVVSIAVVILLGLFISAIGLGGLDDVTRQALKFGGEAGFWVLRPIVLLDWIGCWLACRVWKLAFGNVRRRRL